MGTNVDNACAEGGLIVGTGHAIAARNVARRDGELVGCAHLVCARCGAEVIHLDGVRLERDLPTPSELATLRGATDLDACPLLTRAGAAEKFRVYACACFAAETAGASPAAWVDDVDWSCGGHS